MRRPPDGGPGAIAWSIALLGLVMPWLGALCLLLGFWQISRSGVGGVWLLVAGGACFIADVLIDVLWVRSSMAVSDLPDLNRRGDQLVGRTFVLVEPIEGGRGAVRCGDTLWQVEGPDLARGVEVRVVAAKGVLLSVVPL